MKTAVVLAGGLGTRLRPLTLETPKPLVDIDGRNIMEHSLLLLKRAGITTAYLAIGYFAEKVQAFFGNSYDGITLKYIIEKEPLGTGGWMHLVDKADFTEDFIVMNADDFADVDFAEIWKVHQKCDAIITISLHQVDDVRAFGVVNFDGDRIKGFVEKPSPEEAPSNWVNHGYYIFSPKVFAYAPKQEKFMLERDIFPQLAADGKLYCYQHTGQWVTTNTHEQLAHVKKIWKHPADSREP
ncbi:nucleotidyltransferase family protein [Candidatus Woesearchaeota archaeon]|nr:nucleotidyltransferase family protein [Candidatus Woesearchaeota archaeon]